MKNVHNYPTRSLDNAVFVWNAEEDPGQPSFSLFEKQTKLENCLFFLYLGTAVEVSCSQPRLKEKKQWKMPQSLQPAF